MYKYLLATFLGFASLSIYAQRSYKTVEGDPMKVRIYTLDNGLKVYISANSEKPRVTAHIAVNTGHRNDPAETTGLAHYLEHLMFKGTSHFGTSNYEAELPILNQITDLYEQHYKLTDPEARKAKYHEIDSVSQVAAQYNIPNEYDKLMASIGGESSNAYTWFDVTCYTEDVPSNELDNWAKIQSDRFQNMVIRGFHTELEAVYEEKNISLASDGEKQFDALMMKLFPSHSYGTQTTLGTQEHLKSPSIVNIQNYYKRYYKPNNIAICLVGDLDYDQALATVEKYFGSWQPGNDISPRKFPAQPVFTTPQDSTVVGQEQESIMLAWRFKGAADLQNDTLSLVSHILTNGTAGLIDLDLNNKMEVQEAGAENLALKDYSAFILSGIPNEGQTLDEVKALLLGEIDKLKKGEFDESLLKAIVNNMKLDYNKAIEGNRGRVSILVDAYINGQDWTDAVQQIDRISRITKTDVMRFASEYFTDGYACVKKLQGEDTNVKKIDKPQITAIPTNRHLHSAFLDEVSNTKVESIQPRFVDFEKDITFGKTKAALPVVYKQNNENEIFTLTFRYEFGQQADNRLDVASVLIDLLGTNKLSIEDIQKQFYALGCKAWIYSANDYLNITLTGLNENLASALTLMENHIQNAKADQNVYNMFVEQILKTREDSKKEQKACFSALWNYALYGNYNPTTNVMTAEQLKQTSPQTLIDLLKNLKNYQHTVLYYGPSEMQDVIAIIDKNHKTGKTLAPALTNTPYVQQQTPANEVVIAPYDAKNIYFRKLHNEGRKWNINEAATQSVFNEYFGGGMNTIVFQELREARGLAYNANAYYNSPSRQSDTEYVQEHIISQNDKMVDCIDVFGEITERLPQSESAFQLAKQNIEKSLQCNRITRYSALNYYFQMKRLGLTTDLNETIYRNLPSVTLDSIVNFEKQTMANKPWKYVILGNEKELNMDALQKIGSITRLSLEDIFGY